MEENNVSVKNLPEKSNLWIAGNIAAGIIFINVIIKTIGNSFFTNLSTGSVVVGTIYTVIMVILAAYIGSKFGVQYVVRRSTINPGKIGTISKITALVPIIFFLLGMVLDIYAELNSGLTFADLLATTAFVLAVYFFVKDFLQKSVGKLV